MGAGSLQVQPEVKSTRAGRRQGGPRSHALASATDRLRSGEHESVRKNRKKAFGKARDVAAFARSTQKTRLHDCFPGTPPYVSLTTTYHEPQTRYRPAVCRKPRRHAFPVARSTASGQLQAVRARQTQTLPARPGPAIRAGPGVNFSDAVRPPGTALTISRSGSGAGAPPRCQGPRREWPRGAAIGLTKPA